jgi:hypothetical protein
LATEGARTLSDLVQVMRPELRPALADPLASAWYPEDAGAEALGGLLHVCAGGDLDRYEELLERVAADGIRHFFRVLLRLARPKFVISGIPTFWRQFRRGPATVSVSHDGQRSTISYKNFPYLQRETYWRASRAQLRAMLWVSTGFRADVQVGARSPTRTDIVVVRPELRHQLMDSA